MRKTQAQFHHQIYSVSIAPQQMYILEFQSALSIQLMNTCTLVSTLKCRCTLGNCTTSSVTIFGSEYINNSLTQQAAELIDFINTMALSHQLSLISWGFPQFHAFICFAGLSPASFCALRFALESVSLLTSQVQAVRWTKIFFHVMLFTRKSSANM